ncbi:hypothetical protein ACFL6C_13335, partial [Myxococcota bacterium]
QRSEVGATPPPPSVYGSIYVPMTWSTLPEPEGGPIFPDQGNKKHPTRKFLGAFPLGKLTWQATENQVFKLIVQADPTSLSNTRQVQTVHPDAERHQDQGGYRAALYSETFLTENLFWNNRVALSRFGLDIYPESDNFDERGRTNTVSGARTVNDTIWYEDARTRLQAHSALEWAVDDWLGEHQFKAGVDVSMTWNDIFESIPGGGYYTDSGLNPNDPNSISGKGMPDELTKLIEEQNTTVFGDTEAAFVQDVWKPLDNVTIRPGFRIDSSRMRNWDDEIQVHVNTISPRLGVAWDPFDDGKTQLRAGYYQYVDTGFLLLSNFAGGKDKLTHTFSHNPITDEYDIFVRKEGGESGVVGKDYLKDAFNQRRPRTHEVIAGFSREIIPDFELAADYTFRYNQNQWEDDEVNVLWNDGGDNAIGFVNGEQTFIYSLGAMRDAWIRYHGLQVQLNKRFSRNWQMLASYTWSLTEGTQGTIVSVAFDRPRMREYEFGYLPQDVRHVVKIHGSYRFPHGIVAGGRFRYRSGYPVNRGIFNNFFNDYADRRAPRGFDVEEESGSMLRQLDDQLRIPDRLIMGLRLMWQLEELVDHKVDVIVDVFNMLNLRTPVDVETRNLPSGGATEFGDVVSRLSPFSVQLGLRYRI